MDVLRAALAPPADSRVALLRLRAQRPEMLRSLRELRRRGHPGAATVVLALDPVLVLDEGFEAHGAMVEEALRIAPEAGARVHSGLLRAHARLWTLRGGHRIARRALLEARQITASAAAGEEPLAEALLAFGIAHAAFGLGLTADVGREARALLALAASASGSSVALRTRALASQASGLEALSRGAPGEAALAFEDAIDGARRAGADRTLAIGLANRGFALRDHGETERAASSLHESLALFRSLDDRVHVAVVEGSLLMLGPRGARLDVTAVLRAADASSKLGDARTAASLLLTLVEREGLSRRLPEAPDWLDRAWLLLARVDAPALEAQARRLTATWGPPGHREETRVLEVASDGSLATFGSCVLDLRSRRALPRVLLALARARVESEGAYLSVRDVFTAGWPGEKALEHAAAARVYMAVRALRSLGLRGAIATTPAGYRIEPEITVRLSPPRRAGAPDTPGS